MKRTILYGLAVCVFCIFAGFVYARQILPRIAAYPLRQDYAQDYVGARALLNRADELYPVLGPAFSKIGVDWNLTHRSTHPPTAFLLAIPFTFFSYPLSQVLWMITMYVCIVFTARTFGVTWIKSILAGVLSLIWPPAIWSLYQYTPIWMLGLAVAYRCRDHPFISGIFVAIASMPKFLAAPSLLFHFKRRKWSAFIGFGVLWLVVVALLLIFRVDAITSYITGNLGSSIDKIPLLPPGNLMTYLSSNLGNSLSQIHRLGNGALLLMAWRVGGWIGLVAVAGLILWVIWSGLGSENLAGWACFVWVGIALLPIAWDYSLLPLLPWLLIMLRSQQISLRVLACLSLLAPYGSPFPNSEPAYVAICMLLSGITFAVAARLDVRMADNSNTIRTPSMVGKIV